MSFGEFPSEEGGWDFAQADDDVFASAHGAAAEDEPLRGDVELDAESDEELECAGLSAQIASDGFIGATDTACDIRDGFVADCALHTSGDRVMHGRPRECIGHGYTPRPPFLAKCGHGNMAGLPVRCDCAGA